MTMLFPKHVEISQHKLVATILLLMTLSNCLVEAVITDSPVINTDKGPVRGFEENNDGVYRYFGIPFAKPPVGDLRWKKPAEMDPWDEEMNAANLPNSCVQGLDLAFGDFFGSTMWNANTNISEDCLYLNIWVPKEDFGNKNRSVLVWIYGGGFYSGTSTLDLYMAHTLAVENDIIVVSMQYRLGMLGFLSLDLEEVDDNVGLYDQLLALQWIQTNIGKFGGNKDQVTIMGESAGGVSVGFFLLCPMCDDYFHGAILQSGAPSANWGFLTKEESRARAKNVASSTNCNNLTDGDSAILRCFQTWGPQEFADNQWYGASGMCQFPFVPVIDGEFVPDDPDKLLLSGQINRKPLLLGSNSDESTFFIVYTNMTLYPKDETPSLTPESYESSMHRQHEFYPRSPESTLSSALKALPTLYRDELKGDDSNGLLTSVLDSISDQHFVCPVNRLADIYTFHGQHVYYYWFDQRWSQNPWGEWMGVLHGDEIWFTFGHPLNDSYGNFTDGERQLSRDMMRYWTNFAKTGDPNMSPTENGTTSAEWPVYGPEKRYKLLSVSAQNSTLQYMKPGTGNCYVWDRWMPYEKEHDEADGNGSCRPGDASSGQKVSLNNWTKLLIIGYSVLSICTFRNFYY